MAATRTMFGLWSCLACSSLACSNLLGLREAQTYPVDCEVSTDCQGNEDCVMGRCEPLQCGQVGRKVCFGLTAKTCGDDSKWTEQVCDARCELGACKPVPSCENLATCSGGTSCCKSDVIVGGEFELRYAYGQPTDTGRQYMQASVRRHVQTVALDRFEVTVGRFRRFIDGYGEDRRPDAGAGKYPGLAGSGWRASWTQNYAALPLQQAGLEQQLAFYGQSFDDPTAAQLPVRGVNWYVALAFCIWDGGRLPTESEWSYAASGGELERDYPWGNADLSSAIDGSRAWYSQAAPRPVGMQPQGEGLWKQQDLAGNVREWVFDAYHEQPEPGPCAHAEGPDAANAWACIQLDTVNGTERVLRGGAYSDQSWMLENVRRSGGPSERGDVSIGFRCARDVKDNDQPP